MTDWVQKQVAELIDGLSAGVSVRSVSDAASGPAVLKTSAISKGRFDSNEAKSILPADLPRARQSVLADSMIVSRMNTPELVGEVGYSPKAHRDLYLPDRLWSARARRGSGTDMRWVTYYFASEPGARLLRGLATGTSGSMKNIPKDRILDLEISTPPPTEQRAIANALFAADQLISSLEHLIAKKQAIKTGMMQQLLTGRTRLPGFKEPWEITTLGSIASMGSGGTPLSSVPRYYGGGIPWVSISDMTSRGKYITTTDSTLSEEGLASSAAKLYEPNVLLYAMYASLGECSIAVGRVASSQAILGIKPNSNADTEFLYYWLQALKPQVKTLGQQGTQSNLNAGMVRDFEIKLPQIEEQRAIGAVLADADAELTALQKRLTKARNIKQGMMQQLLTGRTRLPVEAEA